MSKRHGRNLLRESEDPLNCSPFCGKILLIVFVLGLVIYPLLAQQTSRSDVTSSRTFNSVPLPDFSITAIVSDIVPADATTPATMTIVVNPIGDFLGTIVLSDLPLPAQLKCTGIDPATIPNGGGKAMLSCSSIVAGTYAVTITGTSGAIRHNATATFTFAAFTFPDFTIAATSPVDMISATTATSNVTVNPQGGFSSEVNLTAAVYPSTGLSVLLLPQRLVLGSGTATASFSASAPGDYNVTITGISKSLSHTFTIVVRVTLAGLPDFEVSASPSSINLEAGSPSMTRIIVIPSSGFAGAVSLDVAEPSGISCSLSPTSIRSSGTSTLTCNSNTAGEYTITIKATGGTSPHTTTVNVHVAAVSPAAPTSTVLGFAGPIFYGIIAGIIAVVFAGTVLVLRLRGSLARRGQGVGLFFPSAHLLINHMSMHREGVLFKHLQLALDPVLGT